MEQFRNENKGSEKFNLPPIGQIEIIIIESISKEGFNVKRLAALLNIRREYLWQYTRSKIGKSPEAWITEIKLKLAKEKLRKNIIIKDVAFQLGFKEASYFSRWFKRLEGVLPKDWRH